MSSRNSAIVAFALSLISVSLAAQSPPAPPTAPLQQDIEAILAAPALERGFWGVLVKAVDHDEVLYSRNASKLMMPASTMKVVTLAAAAEKLGWDYRYTTRLFTTGAIVNGILTGDLIVAGSGDPSIDDWDGAATQLFADWATQLKAAGIRSIRGRIIGDDNLFDDDGFGFGWSWDDMARSFSASVSALQFNEGSVQLKIAPGRSIGSKAAITVVPDYSGLTISNHLTTGAAGGPAAVVRRRLPGSSRLEIRGSLPLRTRQFSETASVENPTLYFANALRHALVADGIDVHGPAVDIDDLDNPPTRNAAAPLITYQSPPLSELATTMMKLSQNLYAETLLKTIGIDSNDHPTGTAQAGLAAIRSVIGGWNIDPAGLIQADGSGLSRYNYITPETMVAILTHIEHDERLKSAFEATLPIAGRDGTLENRMKGSAADGNARVKTGSLSNVRAMAGYAKTADGETLAFVLFANNFENSSNVIMAAFDSIVERIASFRR
jgi:D-alanyl-D-alanine carboxypeptidase/D-alanyl-D-alanine-endopeptidase (penicillin-binding protein 4)